MKRVPQWASSLLLILAGLFGAAPGAVAQSWPATPQVLSFSVAAGLPGSAGIEAVCCGSPPVLFGDPVRSLQLHPWNREAWLRIESPVIGSVVRITSVVDYAQLYWRNASSGQWHSTRTGDHVPPPERGLAVPGMALPVPANADGGPLFLHIIHPSLLSLRLVSEPVTAMLARQPFDRGLKLTLLGFVLAIVCYNLVLALIVHDAVFLFNALTILSLLIVTAYLSGYGAFYLWHSSPALGEQLMNAGIAGASAFGAIFVRDFLSRGKLAAVPRRLLQAVPLLAALGWLAGLVGPYTTGRHALLAVSALLLATLILATGQGIARRDSQARLLAIPFLLGILPGLIISALHELAPIELGLLPGNVLSVFLAIEAMLFSVVLATRVRQTETALDAAGRVLQQAREKAGERILAAQDAERRRVAQDLHDSVGQQLMLLVGRLRLAVRESEQTAQVPRQLVAQLAGQAHDMLESLRRIARSMHPAMLEHVGWNSAIEALVGEFRRASKIRFELDLADGAAPADRKTALHLYRIVQEGLNNVLRHAKAGQCLVRCERVGQSLRLVIEDDGVGADGAPASATSIGIGLTSIDERVRILAGHWSLGRGRTGGTRLEVSVPAHTKTADAPASGADMVERVLICDDHPLFRVGLRTALERIDNVCVIEETSDGEACVEALQRHRPDILLLDLALPGRDGFSVLEWAHGEQPALRIIVLSMHSERAFADRARALGASAFIAKEDAMSEISTALIQPVGGFYASESVAAQPGDPDHQAEAELGARLQTLSPTERKVMSLLARSLTSREMAEQLGSSYRTVQTHRAHIAEKLGVQGVNRLIDIAIRYRQLFDS
ncbi:MAG: response regulator [Burkholderiaceae bacterium]